MPATSGGVPAAIRAFRLSACEREWRRGSTCLCCLAISAALHLSLALSVGRSLGTAGALRAAPLPAANSALSGFLVQRVSSKVDSAPNEGTVVALEPPASNVAVTSPAAPPQPDTVPSDKIAARGIIPLAKPYYFRASELEIRPRVLSDVRPQFPSSAEGAASGRIVLRLLINEAGRLDTVVVEHSELPQAFQDSAIDAFSKATLAPGEIGGSAVKSQMRIEVSYEQAE